MPENGRPSVLVSNDDGIDAPGLRALVAALVESNICHIYVCAPSGERSAQSHAITLGRYMACTEHSIAGVEQAIGVDGTPADSVMLALHSPVLKVGAGAGPSAPCCLALPAPPRFKYRTALPSACQHALCPSPRFPTDAGIRPGGVRHQQGRQLRPARDLLGHGRRGQGGGLHGAPPPPPGSYGTALRDGSAPARCQCRAPWPLPVPRTLASSCCRTHAPPRAPASPSGPQLPSHCALALQGNPAIAFSLDSHQARQQEDYQASAAVAVAIIKVRAAAPAGGSQP
jgi:hypothetical protein